jgi:hypothetical protein
LITLEFGPDDLLRCRFAISPLWEVGQAAHAVLDGGAVLTQLPWLRDAATRLDDLDLAPLRAVLVDTGGYTPDFLSPPPSGPLQTIEEGLARVRATPAAQVRRELTMSACDAPPNPWHARLAADLVAGVEVHRSVVARRQSPGDQQQPAKSLLATRDHVEARRPGRRRRERREPRHRLTVAGGSP